jgi:uncharacterized protein (TIGR03435 family)
MPRIAQKLRFATVVGFLWSLGNPTTGCAQSAPKFEVVSIRPNTRCGGRGGDSGGATGNRDTSPGRLALNCVTVAELIQSAYVTFANGHSNPGWSAPPFSGGWPAWITSDRYDINAKAPGAQSQGMMKGPMLQALLEDRFKVKIHRETRQVQVYVLTVAKSGAKLEQFQEGSCTPVDPNMPQTQPAPGQKHLCDTLRLGKSGSNLTLEISGMSLEELAKSFGQLMDRPIIDQTGISGLFNFRLEFAPDEATPRFFRRSGDAGQSAAAPDPSGPSIFTAFQEQLGLKLDPAKGPSEIFVIDRVERPSEN